MIDNLPAGDYIVITRVGGRIVRARIVRIGNSKGIRIPKPLIQQTGLGDEVEIIVKNNTLVIARAERPRAHWSEAFRAMAERHDDTLIDVEKPPSTRFDESEWTW